MNITPKGNYSTHKTTPYLERKTKTNCTWYS